jgi:hypothetical protein
VQHLRAHDKRASEGTLVLLADETLEGHCRAQAQEPRRICRVRTSASLMCRFRMALKTSMDSCCRS